MNIEITFEELLMIDEALKEYEIQYSGVRNNTWQGTINNLMDKVISIKNNFLGLWDAIKSFKQNYQKV